MVQVVSNGRDFPCDGGSHTSRLAFPLKCSSWVFEQVVIGGKAREENKPWFRWDFGSVDPIGYKSLLGGIIFLNHDAAFGRAVGI